MNSIKCFDFDDWVVLKDLETGEIIYDGHGGGSLIKCLLEMLEIQQVFLEVPLDKDGFCDGDTEKAINKWIKSNEV